MHKVKYRSFLNKKYMYSLDRNYILFNTHSKISFPREITFTFVYT